jgi:hypothetical protein
MVHCYSLTTHQSYSNEIKDFFVGRGIGDHHEVRSNLYGRIQLRYVSNIESTNYFVSIGRRYERKIREKIKKKTYSVSDANQKAMTRSIVPYFMNTWPLEL